MELFIRTSMERKRELSQILKNFLRNWEDQKAKDLFVVRVDAEPVRIKRLMQALEHARLKLDKST